MNRSVAACALVLFLAAPACKRATSAGADASPAASAIASAAPKPVGVAAFKGTYTQFAATSTSATARKYEANEVSTIVIDDALMTWTQVYSGKTVVETYSFTADNVKPAGDGYDVFLTFKSLDGKNYYPDNINPALEVRPADGGDGFVVTFSYKDTHGTVSRHQFKKTLS